MTLVLMYEKAILVGIVLAVLRKARGLNQTVVAQAVGFSAPSAWSKVERGDHTAAFSHVETACQVLNVDVLDFLAIRDRAAASLRAQGVEPGDKTTVARSLLREAVETAALEVLARRQSGSSD